MKPKMGRPKKENPNTINLTVRLNPDLDKRLTEHCSAENVTKGEVVREGIEIVLGKKE